MAQQWPGKANAVPGNFYTLPDGKVRYYKGGNEFRTAGQTNDGNYGFSTDAMLGAFSRGVNDFTSGLSIGTNALNSSVSGYQPVQRSSTSPLQNPASPVQAVPDSSGRDYQGADLDIEAIKRLAAEFDKTEPTIDPVLRPQIVSDDASARDSALTSMRAQYAPGADIWSTDEGKAILEAAKTNSYGGDAAGLAQFNTQQRQAGIGANPEIIEAMGYEGNMAEWAKANPALAMREYNKKFGNSYEGEGSGDANSVLANGMTAGEDQEAAIKNAEAIIRGTGAPRESNTEVMAPAQNTDMQGQNNRPLNTSMVQEYMGGRGNGLKGKELLQNFADRLYGGK